MKSKTRILRYSIVPICLLIICTIFIQNSNNKTFETFKNNSNMKIYINSISNKVETSMDADINTYSNALEKTDGKIQIVNEEMNKFSFINDLSISDEYNAVTLYKIYTRSDLTKNEYNILNNYVLSIKVKDGTKEFKDIEISFSEEYKPIRDYYFTSDNDKISKIGNTEIQIYNCETSYMAIFRYNNINFDIETRNLTSDEFVEVLTSIIK